MLTYERTPNIKTTSYRLIEDGVEVLRNLTKKAAMFLINRITQEQQNALTEDLGRSHRKVEVQQTKKSIDSRATTNNCAKLTLQGEPRNSDINVSQNTGNEVESKSITNEELSCNNQSSAIQVTGIQQFIEEVSNGDYSRITADVNNIVEQSRNIVEQSRKIANVARIALQISSHCLENFNGDGGDNFGGASQESPRNIDPTTINVNASIVL